MRNDCYGRLVALAIAPPYAGRDLTAQEIEAAMRWLTDLVRVMHEAPGRWPSTEASHLWLQGAVLLQHLGGPDEVDVVRRRNGFAEGLERIRASLAERLAAQTVRRQQQMRPAA